MAKLVYSMCVLVAMVTLCSGSAIPMWEFLGRTEKMSHLYSMFAKEVSKYCKINADTTVTKCKHDLLAFGVGKLENMNDSHLDAMDPYQRSANDIIWDSIMDGHPVMQGKKQQTTQPPIRQPTGQFERNPLFDSADDETIKNAGDRKTTTTDYGMGMGMDMDIAYGNAATSNDGSSYDFPSGPAESAFVEPSNQLPLATNVDFQFDLPSVNAPTTNYLTGPMVIRVRPDGTPVEEDKSRPLPRDDDREAMTIGSGYFPSSRPISEHLQPPKVKFTPDTSVYTNYRTITRRQYN